MQDQNQSLSRRPPPLPPQPTHREPRPHWPQLVQPPEAPRDMAAATRMAPLPIVLDAHGRHIDHPGLNDVSPRARSQAVRRATPPREQGLARQLARSCENESRLGLKMLAIAGGLTVLCVSIFPVSGAVVVSGSMVSSSGVKKVQHPAGGVIAQILARNGDTVKIGDLLVRLSEVSSKSAHDSIRNQLDEATARAARLTAERDGLERPEWPAELRSRANAAQVAQLLESELVQFQARAQYRRKQIELLRKRTEQQTAELTGLTAQAKSRDAQFHHVMQELQGLEQLFVQSLVPLPRITGVRREAERLDGERQQLRASIDQVKSKLDENDMQITALSENFRVEVTKELSETQSKRAEFAEKYVTLVEQFERQEVRAPVGGTVNQSTLHTVGGVVGPGEVMMQIVPERDELLFEAKLELKDIDQIAIGQTATVRFSAFNRATTPELQGTVSYVSADANRDPQSGNSHYAVRISLAQAELQKITKLRLLPGMPADAFLETEHRTIISYLSKPISDQLQRVFRER